MSDVSFIEQKTQKHGTSFIELFIIRKLKTDYTGVFVRKNKAEIVLKDYSSYLLSDFEVVPFNERSDEKTAQNIKQAWIDYMRKECGLKYWIKQKIHDTNTNLIRDTKIDVSDFVRKD